jgi:hypothetical protein
MPEFLIEIPHDDEPRACALALDALERYGSHFVTHARWGCAAGQHSAYLLMELEDRDAALRLVPPQFRSVARIVPLEQFTSQDIRNFVAELAR